MMLILFKYELQRGTQTLLQSIRVVRVFKFL